MGRTKVPFGKYLFMFLMVLKQNRENDVDKLFHCHSIPCCYMFFLGTFWFERR